MFLNQNLSNLSFAYMSQSPFTWPTKVNNIILKMRARLDTICVCVCVCVSKLFNWTGSEPSVCDMICFFLLLFTLKRTQLFYCFRSNYKLQLFIIVRSTISFVFGAFIFHFSFLFIVMNFCFVVFIVFN